MFSFRPVAARSFSRLACQLVPAALVTAVGILLLSNVSKTPMPVASPAPVETAINAEAVFKITPREVQADIQERDARPAKSATHPSVKSAVANIPQSRKATSEHAAPPQAASLPPPLQIVEVPAQPAAATPDSGGSVMAKLRNASAAMQRIPQWAAGSVAGWFAAEAPPRPPAEVPAPPANFQAAM